jgi:hypothetical protein
VVDSTGKEATMRRIGLGLAVLAILMLGVSYAPRATTPSSVEDAVLLPEFDPTVEISGGPIPVPIPIPPSTCGGNVCKKGEYCCNASCGTCVKKGNYCTQQVCDQTE